MKDQSSRLVWEALASIVTKDAFDEVPLVADGVAAARLANELRTRLLADKDGTLDIKELQGRLSRQEFAAADPDKDKKPDGEELPPKPGEITP